ncbi:hypothetical protein B0J18DRAFT_193600 [Chaetomium sp. MPI-SDFR-AT-0129]|nr:hypothetical protein B0J18DRAFT_193600 [Chaetomium sp. MPI-SDFR-AT-0129]
MFRTFESTPPDPISPQLAGPCCPSSFSAGFSRPFLCFLLLLGSRTGLVVQVGDQGGTARWGSLRNRCRESGRYNVDLVTLFEAAIRRFRLPGACWQALVWEGAKPPSAAPLLLLFEFTGPQPTRAERGHFGIDHCNAVRTLRWQPIFTMRFPEIWV